MENEEKIFHFPFSFFIMIIDWKNINRVLVVRLRSIGDTVLATPSLIALRRFLPDAQIDILLEDWVVPLLEDSDLIDNIICVPNKNSLPVNKDKMSAKDLLICRLFVAALLRETKYDVAFNLHGGTTATFFVRASGAKYRVGYKNYQYNFLYTHLAPDSAQFWQQEQVHSAEHQLALLGSVGVPVADKPKSRLVVTEGARNSIENKLAKSKIQNPKSKIALLHPAAAFDSKQWATEKFARVADFLSEKGFNPVAVAAPGEREVLENLKQNARVPVITFDDLSLPEITALAAHAALFVGNDSGIAHIAAAVDTPCVVVFGSSNVYHWRPWTNTPNEVVYSGKGSDKQEFIKQITVENVCKAVEKVLISKNLINETKLKS
ncbi:MAG: glycosyltransferase family 9 protein [Pyrinomonadaceae bacterium]